MGSIPLREYQENEMSMRIYDHTLDETTESEFRHDPDAALHFFCASRRCSWAPDPGEALITKVEFHRTHNGWLGKIEAVYEGTLQFYTIDVKPE